MKFSVFVLMMMPQMLEIRMLKTFPGCSGSSKCVDEASEARSFFSKLLRCW